MFIQAVLTIVDLVGVLLIGLIGSLAVNGIQSRLDNDDFSYKVLDFLRVVNLTFQQQILVLSTVTVFLFMFKTCLSLLITKRTTLFLARRAPIYSSTILGYLFANSLDRVRCFSHHQIVQATSVGVQSLTTGIIGNLVNVVADVLLLFLLALGLTILSPSLSVFVICFFSIVGFLLNKLMKNNAFSAGSQEARLLVEGNQKLTELLESYREAYVRDTRENIIRDVEKSRLGVSEAVAKKNFMPYVSKYVMEASVIFGTFAVSGIQFALYDAKTATMALAIFLGAASRVAPAILRIQQALLQINGHAGQASQAIEILSKASRESPVKAPSSITPISFKHEDFRPEISIENLTFKYSDEDSFQIQINQLSIEAGEHIALVGPSGSGKSTIVDLMLGLHLPNSGRVTISGLAPKDCFRSFPGATAYVPQSVVIANRTLRENVTLGYEVLASEDGKVVEALTLAGLKDFVDSLDQGLDTPLGEHGFRISGGQRQRIGIARAFITNPRMIILDEATSSLDAQTEDAMTSSIRKLKGSRTIITIAHRLSTVKEADRVLYISEGKIIAEGSFEEVRIAVPDFDVQAELMGL